MLLSVMSEMVYSNFGLFFLRGQKPLYNCIRTKITKLKLKKLVIFLTLRNAARDRREIPLKLREEGGGRGLQLSLFGI